MGEMDMMVNISWSIHYIYTHTIFSRKFLLFLNEKGKES